MNLYFSDSKGETRLIAKDIENQVDALDQITKHRKSLFLDSSKITIDETNSPAAEFSFKDSNGEVKYLLQ